MDTSTRVNYTATCRWGSPGRDFGGEMVIEVKDRNISGVVKKMEGLKKYVSNIFEH